MKLNILVPGSTLLAALILGAAGCEKSQSAAQPKPQSRKQDTSAGNHNGAATANPAAQPMPPGHPPIGNASGSVPPGAMPGHPPVEDVNKVQTPIGPDGKLMLAGLTMAPPSGWQPEAVTAGPMSAVAAFTLPRAEGDTDDVVVRITHFPGMRGPQMDKMNIDRWIDQVKKPDGSSATREDARISTDQVGPVKLTEVDIEGTIGPASGMTDTTIENGRLIAVIVDHPNGPHFVKVSGPAKSMDQWSESIQEFLRSAEVKE